MLSWFDGIVVCFDKFVKRWFSHKLQVHTLMSVNWWWRFLPSAHFSHIPHIADCSASPQNRQMEHCRERMSSSIGRGFAVVLQHGDPENGLRKEQIPTGNGSCSGFIYIKLWGCSPSWHRFAILYLASICFKSYSSTTSLNPTFPKPPLPRPADIEVGVRLPSGSCFLSLLFES